MTRVVVGAAIVRDGLVLVQQRAWPSEAAGLWELPGGRVEDGESEVDALRRECAEELGVAITPADRIGPDVVLKPGLVLRIYAATLDDHRAEPRPVEHRAVAWAGPGQLDTIDWLPADRELIPALTSWLAGARADQPQRGR